MLVFRALTLLLVLCTFIYSQNPESLLSEGETQLSSGDLILAESSFNSALKN